MVANDSTRISSRSSPFARRCLNSSVLVASSLSDNLLYSSSKASIFVAISLNFFNSLYSLSNNFLNIFSMYSLPYKVFYQKNKKNTSARLIIVIEKQKFWHFCLDIYFFLVLIFLFFKLFFSL